MPQLWEPLSKESFETVESEISRDWGNDPALRSTRFGRVKGVVVDESSLQPFAEYALIRWDMSEHPLMADFIEAGFDVALKNPLVNAFCRVR